MQRVPFSGDDGEYLYANVSQQAWQEWLVEQTKLINEYRLNPLDPATRSYVRTQAMNFFHNRQLEPYQA